MNQAGGDCGHDQQRNRRLDQDTGVSQHRGTTLSFFKRHKIICIT
jgi:hypothetical protein